MYRFDHSNVNSVESEHGASLLAVKFTDNIARSCPADTDVTTSLLRPRRCHVMSYDLGCFGKLLNLT